jgi:hypothetical protein
MKKNIFIICLTLFFVACNKKTLELGNPNGITSETFWKSEADVISAFAATYGLLRDVNGGYWGVRGIELSNGRGDDFFIRNDVSYLYQLSTFTNTPDNSASTSLWNVSYQDIFRANQIMESVPTVPDLDADKQALYIAEAKFLRGLNYFNLAINFGDVPLKLTVPQSKDEYFTTKSPEADVWAQIIKDFTEVAAGLPVEWPSEMIGRATKGAALGYLGKSYLYTKDWQNAESTLKQLTTAPFNYQLMENYGDNFLASKDNNQESVFEIQVQDVGGTNPWAGENAEQAIGVTTAQEFAPAEVAGWFEVSPTDKLFNEFQKEKTTSAELDPRMYATLIWDYPGATFYNKPFSSFELLFGYKSMYKKYQNYMQNDELTGQSGVADYSSSNNERAMRYADVLLMLAEAVTQQGRPADAYQYVDMIRNRASLADLPTGYSQEQMMAEIRHQRMIEFAREGLRFYDLKRWGLLETEITNSDKVGKEFFVDGKHALFPVPQAEIESNPQMVQNSNW